MTKSQTLFRFKTAVFITIRCEMCGNEEVSDSDTDDEFVEKVYGFGWRVQYIRRVLGLGSLVERDYVLCQHCTDDKR